MYLVVVISCQKNIQYFHKLLKTDLHFLSHPCSSYTADELLKTIFQIQTGKQKKFINN